MKRVQIAEIQEKDIADIARMEKDIFTDPWTERGIKETLSQDNTLVLGAWEEDHVIGYVMMYYVLDEAEIARIAVNPNYRRQGVAGYMLLYMKEKCREKDIGRILLDVRAGNVPAGAFYRKQGFKEDGIRKGYYSNPKEDALLMSLELSWQC